MSWSLSVPPTAAADFGAAVDAAEASGQEGIAARDTQVAGAKHLAKVIAAGRNPLVSGAGFTLAMSGHAAADGWAPLESLSISVSACDESALAKATPEGAAMDETPPTDGTETPPPADGAETPPADGAETPADGGDATAGEETPPAPPEDGPAA